MNKYKIIIAVFLAFFITGCTTNYNIIINPDLSIKDESIGEVDASFFENSTLSHDDTMRNIIRQNIEDINDLNYTYEVKNNGNILVLTGETISIEDYINKKKRVYQQWFRKIENTQTGNVIQLKGSEFYPYNEQDPYKVIIQHLYINITVPFKVIEHNADMVDKKKNVYTWEINKSTMNKEISLSFDTSKRIEIKENAPQFKIPFITVIGTVLLIVAGIMLHIIVKRQEIK